MSTWTSLFLCSFLNKHSCIFVFSDCFYTFIRTFPFVFLEIFVLFSQIVLLMEQYLCYTPVIKKKNEHMIVEVR